VVVGEDRLFVETTPSQVATDDREALLPLPRRGAAGIGCACSVGPCRRARSGDKGGNANLGVWARTPETYAWLNRFLTVDRLKELLPETAPLSVSAMSYETYSP